MLRDRKVDIACAIVFVQLIPYISILEEITSPPSHDLRGFRAPSLYVTALTLYVTALTDHLCLHST